MRQKRKRKGEREEGGKEEIKIKNKRKRVRKKREKETERGRNGARELMKASGERPDYVIVEGKMSLLLAGVELAGRGEALSPSALIPV